jgi:hypothetical protein
MLIVPAFAAKDFKNHKNIKKTISVEEAQVSDVLTFEELVQEIANDTGKSFEQVKSEIIANKQIELENSGDVVKSLDKKSYSEIEVMVSSATYRTITDQFVVTSIYKPYLKFYCETSEGGGYWGIVKILNVGMDREYNNITKQFGGTVYSNLENAGTIFWIVNGDFYDNGTTTAGGGVEIPIGGSATVSFNVSYSSDHYAYCYEEDRYYTY